MNKIKYYEQNQNYRHQKSLSRDNNVNILKDLPSMIKNKMNQIYQEELEESRNQNRFLNDLRNQVFSELRDQRKQDNLKYKQQIEELRKLKDDEEKEKYELIEKIKQQRLQNYPNVIKHKNPLIQPYNNNIYNPFPFNYPNFPINFGGSSLSSSIDELIKVYLLKDIMHNPRLQSDYHRYSSRYDRYDRYD